MQSLLTRLRKTHMVIVDALLRLYTVDGGLVGVSS